MKLTKRAWLFLAVVASLAAFCSIVYLYYTFDGPPPQDADLLPAADPPETTSGENGFELFMKSSDVWWPVTHEAYSTVSGMAFSTEWDPLLAREWVEMNGEAFARIEAILEAPRFVSPRVSRFQDLNGGTDGPYRRLRPLLKVRSHLSQEQGRDSDAFRDALRIIRIGRRLESCRGIPWHCGMGTVMVEDGLRVIVKLLRKARLEPPQFRELSAALLANKPDAAVITASLKTQYSLFCQWLESCSRGKYDDDELRDVARRGSARLLVNRTRSRAAEAYRLAIASVDGMWPKTAAVMALVPSESNWLKWLPRPNLLGHTLFCRAMAVLMRSVREQCQHRFLYSATRVVLAATCFRAETGTLPDRLEDLVPAHLEAVPLDPYDGKPLRYSREKALVYSVGEDMKDSGGSDKSFPERFHAPEPTLKIP